MLELKGVSCSYGKIQVLHDVSLTIGRESVGLFGPNGAGKTTLIGAILGTAHRTSGSIIFDGRPIHNLATHDIARAGIALVPQDRELFPLMSVEENLETGADYIPGARGEKAARKEAVLELFPALRDRLRQPAGTLSGGQQRMVAVGRALMAGPKLLILDEPSLGLQPSLVSELFDRLKAMRDTIAILVTEQNVRAALGAVGRGYVLENGRISFEGDSERLRHDEHVVKSYLGL